MAAPENEKDIFGRIISEKEKRKLRVLNEEKKSEFFGFGMFGMVGWSVTAPTILGILGGIWLDKHYPQSFSWTITCLTFGLIVGCIIAWNWIIKEDQ
ncbi:AtpZ/AtpI family protein [Dyadobacter sp. 3J3]|uniref:AtpZ/AtpI family protein n=1 Tax=Dyadobacter sp. 3J3 TaxID=2606600 RepID=UPI00135AF361|nr:AtpZ/AtpI family protein [Dyadobacter sp. 3J3]